MNEIDNSDTLIIDTGKAVSTLQPTQIVHTELKTFNLVTENAPVLHLVLPHFDFANPPTDPVTLASRLVETCKKFKGIGLTASQCGLSYRVFVMGNDDEYIACFNPEIVDISKEEKIGFEGCLSFPGLGLQIVRPTWVEVEYQDYMGEKRFATFEGLTARVFLHELDHANGIVFTSKAKPVALRMGMKKRTKLLNNIRKSQLFTGKQEKYANSN